MTIFCNFFGTNFNRNREEQEEEEQQQQQQEKKEKKFTVAIEKAPNVLPSCLDSEDEKDISKKSTERQQQKQETTRTKNPTYSEKWLTAKDIAFPSNRGSVSSLSVISIHSCFSGLDSLKRMRTRATDISMSFLWGSLSDKGS